MIPIAHRSAHRVRALLLAALVASGALALYAITDAPVFVTIGVVATVVACHTERR